MYILFHILFHYGLPQDIDYSSLWYTAGPCCLSILYTPICIQPVPNPTLSHSPPLCQLPLLRCQEPNQSTACDPCTQHHEGGGQTTWANLPTRPTNPPLPSPPLRDQLTCPPLESQQRHLWLVFTALCYIMSSSKALPEFLVWPLNNFCWLKSSRTQAGNKQQQLKQNGSWFLL